MDLPLAPEDILGSLKEVLIWLGTYRTRRKKEKQELIEAMYAAVIATRKYQEEVGKSGKKDREKEYHLSQLWSTAAAKAYVVEAPLTNRLDVKGQYWRRETKWTRLEVYMNGIDLDSIEEMLGKLIRGDA